MEQRAAYFLLERGIKHLKGLGAAHEIVGWIREKDARRFCLHQAAHVAKALDPLNSLPPRFFRVGPGVNPVFNAEQFRHRAVAQQHDAHARPRFRNLAGGHRSPFQARPVRTRGLR